MSVDKILKLIAGKDIENMSIREFVDLRNLIYAETKKKKGIDFVCLTEFALPFLSSLNKVLVQFAPTENYQLFKSYAQVRYSFEKSTVNKKALRYIEIENSTKFVDLMGNKNLNGILNVKYMAELNILSFLLNNNVLIRKPEALKKLKDKEMNCVRLSDAMRSGFVSFLGLDLDEGGSDLLEELINNTPDQKEKVITIQKTIKTNSFFLNINSSEKHYIPPERFRKLLDLNFILQFSEYISIKGKMNISIYNILNAMYPSIKHDSPNVISKILNGKMPEKIRPYLEGRPFK